MTNILLLDKFEVDFTHASFSPEIKQQLLDFIEREKEITELEFKNDRYDEGYSDGYDEGYSEGKSEGYDDGYEDGEKAEKEKSTSPH